MRNEALERCPWLCSAPSGPSTPFDWPVFFVVDSLRLLMTLAAAALIVIAAWSARRSAVPGQKARFVFTVALCTAAAGTELDHLGDVPNWRFVVNLVGLSLGLWGHHQYLSRELPAGTPGRRDPGP